MLGRAAQQPPEPARERARARIAQRALAVLAMPVFSKCIYMASLSSYYTFFLIEKFHVKAGTAQVYLFLASVPVGTFAGGPIGDRIGHKRVIRVSILGILAALLPTMEKAGAIR
jgi:FSR family fosmidomycin resistance protein-like MFS transporter